MLLRRLYSSLPAGSTRPSPGNLSSGPSTPARPPTRGRSKPTARLALSSRPSSAASASSRGVSRRRRSTSSPSSAEPSASQAALSVGAANTHSHPTAHDYSFRPAQIYPQQMWLHQSFVPRHMPIPVGLSSRIYTAPAPAPSAADAAAAATTAADSELGPFARPAPPSAHDMLRMSAPGGKATALRDHLRVTAALSRPDLVKHLGEPARGMTPAPHGAYDSSEGLLAETDLVRTLAEAGVRNRLSGEWQWEQTLARLGAAAPQPSSATASASSLKQASQSQSADVDSAVDDLSILLGKLAAPSRGRRRPRSSAVASTPAVVVADSTSWAQGRELRAALLGEEDAEDLVVRMDSVKRKRRKKISKHKYKKRRKATRALRRKMGK